MSEPTSADVASWIAAARAAMQSDDDADLRALLILDVAQRLAAVSAIPEQATARQKLERAALAMAGLRNDDLRRPDILGDMAKAWMAFEGAWGVESSKPITN